MRLRLDLSYDGSGFHGWARQPSLRTVQGDLEAALDTIMRVAGTRLVVAGRTDTGVHARGQVAHLDVADDVEWGRLARRLNSILQTDVRVREVSVAPDGFDARFSAMWRRYAYRIVDDPALVDPLTRSHVLTWKSPLDEHRMNQAAELLLGLHDFASFCKQREGATTIRALHELHWERDPRGILEATVRADAFCHHMVRSLVGCMIAVGEGRRDPSWSAEVLARRERDANVAMVLGHGLTLEEVGYPADAELASRADAVRKVRTHDE